MRRALEARLPALSFHFRVTSDDLDRMPLRRMVQYANALAELDSQT